MITDIVFNIAKYCKIIIKIRIKKCQKRLNDRIKIYRVPRKKSLEFDTNHKNIFRQKFIKFFSDLSILNSSDKLSDLRNKMNMKREKLKLGLRKKYGYLSCPKSVNIISYFYIRDDKTIDYYVKESEIMKLSIVHIFWNEDVTERIGKKDLKTGKFYI